MAENRFKACDVSVEKFTTKYPRPGVSEKMVGKKELLDSGYNTITKAKPSSKQNN